MLIEQNDAGNGLGLGFGDGNGNGLGNGLGYGNGNGNGNGIGDLEDALEVFILASLLMEVRMC